MSTGLALARRCYHAWRDTLFAGFEAWRPRAAAGLVGHGSECFGFDDALSRDHDFGPGFCVWLGDADFAAIGPALQAAYDALPARFEGFGPRIASPRAGQRVGVFSLSGFYSRFLGAPQLPISDADWLQIPEPLLAAAVNGEVFEDPAGAFSAIRAQLAAYYPEGVRRRKLAQAAAKMAQSGQYNLPRALARGEDAAALLAQADFLRHSCLLAHALERRYAPHDKWLHRSTAGLASQPALHARLAQLARTPPGAAPALVETICAEALAALIAHGLTRPGDGFLETHVDAILGHTA
ncbi:MAG: DUF4037 domain-containing protein [Candidatus Dactylopiibacterium sp.]|nr:DUF4037 domain-containing protein [Candidatus Dactylopiibacterium sp.]